MQSQVSITQNMSIEPGKGKYLPTKRLIVLVPSDKFDEQAFSMRVRAISEAWQSVLWLALASDPESDDKIRHCLKYLAALISNLRVQSEYKLAYFDNWLDAIQSVWTVGDRIVCLEGHMDHGSLFTQKPLAQRLAANNAFSIDVIQGVDLQKPSLFRGFWRGIFEWAFSIGIIVAFFFIQAYIFQNTSPILGKVFIFISILVELWLIVKLGTGW